VKRNIVDTTTHASSGNGLFLPFRCRIPLYEEMATSAVKNTIGKYKLIQTSIVYADDCHTKPQYGELLQRT
jgi:hypothetical protein